MIKKIIKLGDVKNYKIRRCEKFGISTVNPNQIIVLKRMYEEAPIVRRK